MQKVLIVVYYWPPAGGPGVQRWLKFIKYLPEFGFEPIVFIPKNPNYPIQDDSLLNEIPNVRVIEQPIFEPYRLASVLSKRKTKRISSGIIQKHKKQTVLERLLLWIRGNFFIPDARKYWVKPSVRKIEQLFQEEKIDTIITTGPPHSVHLIGLRLKAKLNLKWVADFRDPWTSIGYHKKLKLSKRSHRKHKELEREVLTNGDQLVVTSKTTKEEFSKINDTPITVITNGFESEKPKTSLDAKFTLSHIGSLLTDRNPAILWQVLKELVSENEAFKNNLKIQLVGVVGDGVKESLKENGLYDFVTEVGYVSHDKVLEYQSSSQALLLLEIDSIETRGIIPGKLFEYLNAQRPILALGPKSWEAGELVEKHKAGSYFTSTDVHVLKKVLLDWFEQFQKGDLQCNSEGIEQYHRRELTKNLAKLLAWES